MLRRGSETLTITEPVRSIAQLVAALDHAPPVWRRGWTIFNFALNDEMLLHASISILSRMVMSWRLCRQFLEDEAAEAWRLLTLTEVCIPRTRSKGQWVASAGAQRNLA
jgi:hypothetical protein